MPNTITRANGLGQAVSPEEWAKFVIDHLSHESVALASGATRINTTAKMIHVPRLTSDGGVQWVGELEEISTDRPEGDDLVLVPKKVAALVVLSNEAVADSDPAILDVTGGAMLRAIALEADRAIFHGEGGLAPTGILEGVLPTHNGLANYEGIVRASGVIRAAGGRPDVVYLSPLDMTELQLATGADDRPLLQPDASQGAAATVAGLRIYVTNALDPGETLVAVAAQIVVGIRSDASVSFSTDARFSADATLCRVIARLDCGVGDADGLCLIQQGS